MTISAVKWRKPIIYYYLLGSNLVAGDFVSHLDGSSFGWLGGVAVSWPGVRVQWWQLYTTVSIGLVQIHVWSRMLIQRRQSGSGDIGGGPGDATGASRRHDPLSGRHAAPRQTHLHVLCPHLVKATHTSVEHGRPVTYNNTDCTE